MIYDRASTNCRHDDMWACRIKHPTARTVGVRPITSRTTVNGEAIAVQITLATAPGCIYRSLPGRRSDVRYHVLHGCGPWRVDGAHLPGRSGRSGNAT